MVSASPESGRQRPTGGGQDSPRARLRAARTQGQATIGYQHAKSGQPLASWLQSCCENISAGKAVVPEAAAGRGVAAAAWESAIDQNDVVGWPPYLQRHGVVAVLADDDHAAVTAQRNDFQGGKSDDFGLLDPDGQWGGEVAHRRVADLHQDADAAYDSQMAEGRHEAAIAAAG